MDNRLFLPSHFFDLQYRLLQHILLTTALFSFVIALSSSFAIYPLESLFRSLLYLYATFQAGLYVCSRRWTQYYKVYVYLLLGASYMIFMMMMVYVTHDAFRLVWFFLLAFTAYILGDAKIGRWVSLSSFVGVLLLWWVYDLHLSWYAMSTFMMSSLAFSLFLHYFLSKIAHDTMLFESMVEAEVTKRQTQEQILLRKYRMANMGEMIDAIAHQWRQPLAQGNMILLNMEEELENSSYIKEKIKALSTLNQHMSQTIEDFRKLLHETQHKSTFDINEMVAELQRLMKHQLQDVTFIYTNSTQDMIEGYKNELMQVLIILVSNALDALDSRAVAEKKIRLTLEHREDNLYIAIEDNAGGIEPSVMQRLFEPYVTTKQSSGGTGLGLYIAKLIIEDIMHGHIDVSRGAEGACFEIEMKRER